jgi:thymidylate synthase (FAD)
MEKGHTIKVHEHGYVRYIDHMGDDTRIVEAARISYKSPSKGPEQDGKLLRYLFRNKHTSPFEMVKIVFNVKMPIFVMRQWVRHRMQNLNEVSGRYSELPDEFYIPNPFRAQDKVNKQGSVESVTLNQDKHLATVASCYRYCYTAYQSMLADGVAKELARIVLPVGIYTEIYSCWDMCNLLKFFALRDDSHAQSEIKDYAVAMKEITRELFPVVMDVYDEMLNDKEEMARIRQEHEDMELLLESIYSEHPELRYGDTNEENEIGLAPEPTDSEKVPEAPKESN